MAAPEKAQIKSPIPHLWQIAAAGEVDQLENILNRGADINASNPSGLTPLMVAAYHGRIEMVRALIERGAEVNATDDEGLTAAMLADDAGHDEIVRLLVGRAVKRKRTGPPPETSELQSGAGDIFDAAAEPDTPAPPASEVRTLHEPPDIWDMVHETQTEFNAGSAFFGRLTLRHCVMGAAGLLIIGSVSAVCYVTLRRSSGGNAIVVPAQTQKEAQTNMNRDLRTARSNANKPVRDQRSVSKAPQTTVVVRSVFDSKAIVTGARGLRDAAADSPRVAGNTVSLARPTVALFHADDKKRTQKANPHIVNSPIVTVTENRDRSPSLGAKSENDKKANSSAARRETPKVPNPESVSPPKPNPTPKGKVIQWPQ